MEETDTKAKIRKIRIHVVAIISIILFAIAISPKSLQNDTFYTIKIGEYIQNNGISNLTEDPFSWHELPYTFPHWLYDFMMFNIYDLFGFDGIYVSTIVFAAILGILMYILCNILSKHELFSIVGTILGMYCMKSYIAARAQLVTFSLFILTIIFIEKFIQTGKKRYTIPLFIIPILIANLHVAVWPFYFVLYLPYIAEYILSLGVINIDVILYIKKFALIIINKIHKLKSFDKKISNINNKLKDNKQKRKYNMENPYKLKIERNKNEKWLILIAIICIFTGLLTPIGLSTPYTYLYKTMSGNTTEIINEHLPLTLAYNRQCIIFLVVSLAVLIFTDTKIKARHMFFLIGLTALTFKTRRQFSLLSLIGIPIVIGMLSTMFENHVPEMKKKLLKVFTTIVGALLIVIVVFLVGTKFYKQKEKDEYITASYPVEASDWILNNLDIENIRLFNEYNYGSYLLFRDIPVMIDSRCDLYTPEYNTKTKNPEDGEDIFMDVQNVCTLAIGYESIFTKYDITHVISYSNSKLSMLLRRDDRYKILYNNNGFTIYERNLEDI